MEHGEEVVASESFRNLTESTELMREVMTAAFENIKKQKLIEEKIRLFPLIRFD